MVGPSYLSNIIMVGETREWEEYWTKLPGFEKLKVPGVELAPNEIRNLKCTKLILIDGPSYIKGDTYYLNRNPGVEKLSATPGYDSIYVASEHEYGYNGGELLRLLRKLQETDEIYYARGFFKKRNDIIATIKYNFELVPKDMGRNVQVSEMLRGVTIDVLGEPFALTPGWHVFNEHQFKALEKYFDKSFERDDCWFTHP